MLNKTYYVFVIVLISGLLPSTSFAQTSGYQGKKFFIGYGGDIGYAMFSRNSSGSSLFATSEVDFPDKLFSFNYKHQAHMELVLSNEKVLGIQGSFGKTQFKALDKNDIYKYYYSDIWGDHQSSESLGKSLYGNMKIVTFGVYLKNFTSNTAPIGKYWAYKLSLLRYTGDMNGIKTPYNFPKTAFPADEYHTSLVFAISHGTSRIYFNRLIVDSNIEFGLPFVIPYFGFDVYNYEYNPSTYNEIFAKRMANRLLGSFLFNVNVNVSLLAF